MTLAFKCLESNAGEISYVWIIRGIAFVYSAALCSTFLNADHFSQRNRWVKALSFDQYAFEGCSASAASAASARSQFVLLHSSSILPKHTALVWFENADQFGCKECSAWISAWSFRRHLRLIALAFLMADRPRFQLLRAWYARGARRFGEASLFLFFKTLFVFNIFLFLKASPLFHAIRCSLRAVSWRRSMGRLDSWKAHFHHAWFLVQPSLCFVFACAQGSRTSQTFISRHPKMQRLLKAMPDVRKDYIRELDTALVESRALSSIYNLARVGADSYVLCFLGQTLYKLTKLWLKWHMSHITANKELVLDAEPHFVDWASIIQTPEDLLAPVFFSLQFPCTKLPRIICWPTLCTETSDSHLECGKGFLPCPTSSFSLLLKCPL